MNRPMTPDLAGTRLMTTLAAITYLAVSGGMLLAQQPIADGFILATIVSCVIWLVGVKRAPLVPAENAFVAPVNRINLMFMWATRKSDRSDPVTKRNLVPLIKKIVEAQTAADLLWVRKSELVVPPEPSPEAVKEAYEAQSERLDARMVRHADDAIWACLAIEQIVNGDMDQVDLSEVLAEIEAENEGLRAVAGVSQSNPSE